MKTYKVSREPTNRVSCVVHNEVGDSYDLPHLVHHSPDGFEFGYGGSGPSDLARSIVGDLLNIPKPDPQMYRPVLWEYIANVSDDTDEFEITETEIRASIGRYLSFLERAVNHKETEILNP